MSLSTTVTIEPNDKYREVVLGKLPNADDVPETEAEYNEVADHADTADAFVTLTDEAADVADEYVEDPDELPTVSWEDLSVSSDSDLVAKMATYFDGVTPDEPLALIRSKLRLLDVDVYINAQLAARAELRQT